MVAKKRWARYSALFSLAASLAALPSTANADDPNEAAESLFQEARRLVDAKRYTEACPKLLASYKLAPAVGTLLNLADCYERTGQIANAWVRFNEAILLAQRLGRADREKTATERALRLEPRVVKLTITRPDPNVEVKVDGYVVSPNDRDVPIDSGVHTIDASAQGKKPFAKTIDVPERAGSLTVEIPALEADATSASSSSAAERPRNSSSAQVTLGIVGMSLGGVGVVLGTVFGLGASSKWSASKEHCSGLDCDQAGVDLAASAKTAGTMSTVSFIAGGVLFASGVVLVLTAPKSRMHAASLNLGIGASSLTVRGAF